MSEPGDPRLTLHYGDLSDGGNLQRIIEQVQPDEIYNLGAQSHVAVSFESPEYTANVDVGTLRILEAVRICGLAQKPASTKPLPLSSMAWCRRCPSKKHTFFTAQPLRSGKALAYWITVNYREAYGMYACNGFCLITNHHAGVKPSSPRKITEDWHDRCRPR